MRRKLFNSNVYAEGFITIDFNHADFPSEFEVEIRRKKKVVDTLFVLVGVMFVLVISSLVWNMITR